MRILATRLGAAVLLPLAIAVVVPAIGCDKLREKAAEKAGERRAEKASGGGFEVDDTKFTIKDGKNGGGRMTFSSNGALPPDFPKEVPVYPGAKVISSIDTSDPAKSGFMVVLESGDTRAAVSAFYKSKMVGDARTEISGRDDMTLLGWTDAAGNAINVMVSTAEDGKPTSFTLTVGREKK